MDKDEIVVEDNTMDLGSPNMRREMEEYSAAKLRKAEKREEAELNRVGLTDKLLDGAAKVKALARRAKNAVLAKKHQSENQH
ncbi:MAG: hypothetical protein Q4E56_01755 [Pseudomonadota bacterium]|nr:hypothetical protein [Pseudomonadota bacterium]